MKQDVKIDNLDLSSIRRDFPILNTEAYGKKVVYFDNGATSQKPKMVIDAIADYYEHKNANVHRGAHYLSQLATDAYELARDKVKNYINAPHRESVIFTSGTTDSINLVAQSFGRKYLNEGDEIIISTLEHHSNIVPWQLIAEERKAKIKVIPLNDDGSLDEEAFYGLFTDQTKILALSHVSNALGTINPVEKFISFAKNKGVYTLLDGAQALAHMKVDVEALNCDFYAFSGHKMFAPTGIGILYAKKELLASMPPYRGGGEMISEVSFEKSTWADLPYKFEAGTPNIEGAIGLGAAIDYLERLDKTAIKEHEDELLNYAQSEMLKIDGLRIYGTSQNKVSVISFLIDDIHPFDIGSLLDKLGIAVRTGHHCTQPLMNRFNIPGTIRASFAFYNTKEEIDQFIQALKKALSLLR